MPYIKECIESIQNQNYKKFNIIVLENSSNDGTAEYLGTLNDGNIEIIPSNALLSIEENWSRIKDSKRNEYMIVTCADDRYYPNYLTEILKLIDTYPDASIYRANLDIINEKSEIIGDGNILKRTFSIYDYLYGRLTHAYFASFAGYCYKSSDYDSIGGIDCVFGLMHPDDVCVMKLAGKSYLAISSVNAASYRSHAKSASRMSNFEDNINGYNYFIDWIISLKDNKLTQILKEYLPIHLNEIKPFFTDSQMLELKKRYKELNINDKNFHYKFIKIKEKIKRKIRRLTKRYCSK
jgi:GT2 family glycosyltransferase